MSFVSFFYISFFFLSSVENCTLGASSPLPLRPPILLNQYRTPCFHSHLPLARACILQLTPRCSPVDHVIAGERDHLFLLEHPTIPASHLLSPTGTSVWGRRSLAPCVVCRALVSHSMQTPLLFSANPWASHPWQKEFITGLSD